VTSSAIFESQEALSITLPAYWQRVQAEKLLDDALVDLADPAIVDAVGHAEVKSAQRQLTRVRNVCHAEHVVLAAIRIRRDARAIDQLSLALPGMEEIASRDSRRNRVSNADQHPETTEDVQLNGQSMVCHRSIAAESPEESGVAGSQVQLVFIVPGSERGAVLTLLSSAVGVEDLLRSDALEIAASAQITGGDEIEGHVAF